MMQYQLEFLRHIQNQIIKAYGPPTRGVEYNVNIGFECITDQIALSFLLHQYKLH